MAEKSDVPGSPLALNQVQMRQFHRQIMERTDTSASSLEEKRRELAGGAQYLEGLWARLTTDVPPLAPEHQKIYDLLRAKREKGETLSKAEQTQFETLHGRKPLDPKEKAATGNTAMVLGMLMTVRGLEILADALTYRVRIKDKKTGKKQTVRRSAAWMMYLGLVKLSQIQVDAELSTEMVNEIGIGFKAFKDKDGVFVFDKYFDPNKELDEGADEGIVVDEEDEDEEHVEPITPDDIAKKHQPKADD